MTSLARDLAIQCLKLKDAPPELTALAESVLRGEEQTIVPDPPGRVDGRTFQEWMIQEWRSLPQPSELEGGDQE